MKSCPICRNENNQSERILNDIELLKCCRCNFVFADVTDEQIEKVNSGYNDISTSISAYEDQQTILDEIWFKNIARKFTKLMGQGKVLDVGCGNCLLLKYFKLDNWDCHGVDSSSWSKEYSKEYGITIIQGKLEELDLDENSFDLVVSSSTMEHIPNPLEHVNEIVRLTKPYGQSYFTGIPNYGSSSVLIGLSGFYCNVPPGHVNYFTPETLSSLFNSLKATPRSIRIQTYGIPEMHKIYDILSRIANRRTVNLNYNQKTNEAKPDYKYCLARLIVYLHYYIGKPFSMGDKLEATLIK